MLPRTATAAVLAGLLLLTAAAYARGMNGDFQFDDPHTVQLNRGIRHPGSFITISSLVAAIHGRRVLTDLTFALNRSAAGPDPFSFHATNLAIHLAATLLVFFFTRRVLSLAGAAGGDFLALIVTALFALHPLQTQAVIYISQRAESLSSALYLGSLLLLLRAEKRGFRAAGAALYFVSFILFALGLSAKVIVATLPVAYLLIGVLPGPQDLLARPAKRSALAAPFFAYALATSFLTVTGLKGEDAGFLIPFMPPGRYFLTQWHVVATYLRLLFWPTGQNVDWDFPVAQGLADPAVLGSGFLLLLLLTGAGILFWRGRLRSDRAGMACRTAAFGVAWFFLLLSPTSSVVPLADVLMEHRMYLASWGIFLAAAVLAAGAVERLTAHGRPVLLAGTLACLCAVLAFATYLRVGLWQSKQTLWSDCVAKSPRKARAHLGLGNGLGKVGKYPQAVEEFRAALELAKGDPRWIRQEIRGKLATALLYLGRADEAVVAVQAGLAEDPKDANLLGLLAMAHLQRRSFPAAEAAARDSAATAKEPAASLQILGMVLAAKGDRPGATAVFEQAVHLDPEEPQGRILLANAYHDQGRLGQACDLLRGPAMKWVPQVKQALADCPGP